MLNFLDKTDLNKMKILQLLNNSNDDLTLDSISSHLFLDKRTVQSLLIFIETDIQKMNVYKKVTITQSKKGSLYLNIDTDFSLQFFFLFYLKKSILFNFCLSIFNCEFTTSAKFAKDNYISLSTFKNRLAELRKLLSYFDLELNLSADYPLIGEEKQIRHFYFYFFWNSYQTIEWPFQKIKPKELKTFFDGNVVVENFSFSDVYKIIFWFSITIIRVKQDFTITPNKTYITLANNKTPFVKFYPIVEQLFQKFDIFDEKLLVYESEFLYFCSSLLGILPLQEYSNLDLIYSGDSLFNTNRDISHIWIREFCEFFSVSISMPEYHYLLANLTILFNKIIFLKGPNSNFSFLVSEKNLIKTYFYYFEQIEGFVSHLKKIKRLKLITHTDHNISEFYNLLVWEILFEKKQKLTITLQSTFSPLHISILKKEITNMSKIPLDIRTTISKETMLIVSDVAIPKKFSLEKEVFLWNTFPSSTQFQKLNKKMELIYQNLYSK